jgi:hypothetical protein
MTKSVAPPFRACPDPAVAGEGAAHAGPACGAGAASLAPRFAKAKSGASSVKNLRVSTA